MGIISITEETNCKIALWEISESLEDLMKLIKNAPPNFSSEKRKKEWIISRLLLNEISPNTTIFYNDFGAPTLNNNNHMQ